mgnify:CR=1 FL=1
MSQHASRQVAAGRLDLLVKIKVAGDRRVATALLAPALEQPVDLHVVSLVGLGAAARAEDLVLEGPFPTLRAAHDALNPVTDAAAGEEGPSHRR